MRRTRPFPLSCWALLPLCLLMTGCELAPDYKVPDVPTPAAYKEDPAYKDGAGKNDAGWRPAQPADRAPKGHWWTVYGIAELDTLEARLGDNNQNLKAAAARYDQARAVARSAKAELYPTLDATGSYTERRLSDSIANPLPNRRFHETDLGLDLNYEIDIWGKVRDQARAEKNRAEASASDLATIDLSLHAELAIDYFSLRGFDAQGAILARTAANYQKSVDLTQSRFDAGYASAQDVSAAKTLLDLARAKAADVALQRAQLEHAIAILLGDAPAAFSLPVQTIDQAPPVIAAVLPGALLERRPDIAAAERRVAAANAQIGVTRAAFYPSFTLGALLGTDAVSASSLFGSPATTWALGPSGVLNLFDGGRRRAQNDQAKAQFEEQAADYRQAVLTAWREVEDNLAALRLLAEENDNQDAAVRDAKLSSGHAANRYDSGYAAYYDVVTAQTIELSAELSDADVKTRRLNASVLLIKAVGGDWRPS